MRSTNGLMVWRADVVGAQGSSKHAYWVTGPATLPAGGYSKAEPAGGHRTSPPVDSGHLPELQGFKAEAQANTLSSFTGRAGQGIRPPIPGGLLLATACSQTLGTYTANLPCTRHPTYLSRSTAAKAATPYAMGFISGILYGQSKTTRRNYRNARD